MLFAVKTSTMALARCISGRSGYSLFKKTFGHQFLRNFSGISYSQLKQIRKLTTPALHQAVAALAPGQIGFYSTDSSSSCSKFEISYEELLERLDSGDLQLIDVREPKELEQYGQIPHAVNIPLTKLKCALSKSAEEFSQTYGIPKPVKGDTNVVFYGLCDIKGVSAVEIAYKLGYKYVRHYPGGFVEWSQKREASG